MRRQIRKIVVDLAYRRIVERIALVRARQCHDANAADFVYLKTDYRHGRFSCSKNIIRNAAFSPLPVAVMGMLSMKSTSSGIITLATRPEYMGSMSTAASEPGPISPTS